MGDDDIAEEARRRSASHKNHPTHRPLSKDYDLVGLRGEEAFARAIGAAVDMQPRLRGDNGKDFELPFLTREGIRRFKVDLKTYRKPYNLLGEVGTVKPLTIYVLAGYSDVLDRATLLGWEWGSALSDAPTRDFGYGVINHYILRDNLRQISELMARITRDHPLTGQETALSRR